MQILLFLIFILLVLLVMVSKKNSFSKNQKIIVTSVVTLFAISIYFYESSIENDAQYNREMVNAFRQGKNLTCKEFSVDNKKFIYISGTQTFIPKDGETTLEGVIVRVSTCKVD